MNKTSLQRIYKKNGVNGILEIVKQKKRYAPLRLLLTGINKLFPFEDILKTTAKFDDAISEKGFHSAVGG